MEFVFGSEFADMAARAIVAARKLKGSNVVTENEMFGHLPAVEQKAAHMSWGIEELVGGGYIVVTDGGRYNVTPQFDQILTRHLRKGEEKCLI